MAVKTFTTNEVLTASDTNTYLANAGLVYVTSASFTGTSWNINTCFTSTMSHYRVLVEYDSPGGNDVVFVQLRTGTTNTATGYYHAGADFLAAPSVSAQGGTNSASIRVGALSSGIPARLQLEFFKPQAAAYTGVTSFCQGSYSPDSRWLTVCGGHLANTTSYDGFNISTTYSASGTITVYGYRKA
jgi:hypothetical protein